MTDTGEKTGTFQGPHGLHIFYRSYQAEEERARLVIAHGIGEHSGRYGNVVNKIVPDGVSVWAMDLRGHGKSDGRRGHISAFADYITDLASMLRIAGDAIPKGTRCFLLGHSMDGMIALDFSL